jgi:hypothetical protein
MSSELKFISHSQRIELILGIQHIRKPLIDVLHELHLVNRLPVFPFSSYDPSFDPAQQLIRKSK